MHTTSSSALWVASSLLWASMPSMAQQAPQPSVQLNAMTYKGCFSSSSGLTDKGSYQFQAQGYCQKVCAPLGKAVMGLSQGTHCWCGDELPPANSKVSESECTIPCKGYDKNICGGNSMWTVYLTGTNNNVGSQPDQDKAPSHSASPSPSPTPPPRAAPHQQVTSIITLGGQTQTVTRANPDGTAAPAGPATPSPTKAASSTGKTAGIAAGVVVGVVLVAALVGGIFIFLRRRKRRAMEEEHRRNAVVSGFATGKPGSASSIADSRLDPSVMMQRRMSDGSMADNEDYSRRILKVTNPDGT